MITVTDIHDHGDKLVIFVTAGMARVASMDDPSAIDVARRFSVSDPEQVDRVDRVKRWLLLDDED